MSTFITALVGENGISADMLWGILVALIPLLIITIPFAFGYRISKKQVNGLTKGKARI